MRAVGRLLGGALIFETGWYLLRPDVTFGVLTVTAAVGVSAVTESRSGEHRHS